MLISSVQAEKVNGFGNFHAPLPVLDGISLMLIHRAQHNFLSKLDKFLAWQVNLDASGQKSRATGTLPL
jgi:hypothetical protein